PVEPDFRGKLREALASSNSAERVKKLASLAQYRLGFLETLQLDRALSQQPPEPTLGFPLIRLAVLSSSTVDHLVPAIRVAGLRRGLLIQVHIGAYGQYRQDLLDRASSLYRFAPQVVLFSLSAREAIAGVALTASSADVEE